LKLNSFFGKIRRFSNTVLSRLLITYIAIMVVMLAVQSLLMGGIYQQQYISDRVSGLRKEATDLSLLISQEISIGGNVSTLYPKEVYDVARRQKAVVWVVKWNGTVEQMQPNDASKTGSSGDTVPSFKEFLGNGDDFLRYFKRVMSGDIVTEQDKFEDLFGAGMLTVGVPIHYQDVTRKDTVIGAIFMHAKMQPLNEAIGKMYGHIATSASIAMVVGFMLILLMSARISKPLAQMNEIAGRIARGDFSKKADAASRDEIGQLARSFNTMAEGLKKQEALRSGFVANVSHELRSPLTSIHGFAQGMLDGTIPQGDYQKYLEVIVGETRRLNKLIRELLDLSQIDSGTFPLNMQAFDVNELISRVLITFEEKIVNKSLEIEVDFRQDKAMVLADPDRIEQVVINLLDNAVKYTGQGGRIKIWTHGAANRILIGISDDGPGIPEEDQPYVWERFYKVDKSHSGKKGTGLGLSIVKKIIEQHGERITLQSKPGCGAVFVFSLKKPDSPERNHKHQGE
jgi:signal transduction histidine kinase